MTVSHKRPSVPGPYDSSEFLNMGLALGMPSQESLLVRLLRNSMGYALREVLFTQLSSASYGEFSAFPTYSVTTFYFRKFSLVEIWLAYSVSYLEHLGDLFGRSHPFANNSMISKLGIVKMIAIECCR